MCHDYREWVAVEESLSDLEPAATDDPELEVSDDPDREREVPVPTADD